MRKSVLTFLLSIASAMLIAQVPAHRSCGTMDNLQRLLQEDPALAGRMQQIENQTAAYVAARAQNSPGNTVQSIITIPVVFHVVYANAAQNISDAQCIAQLNQLNLDYAHINTDASNAPAPFLSVAANTQVQFCLAQRDPNGNSTTGVIHKSTTTSSFSSNDNVKHNSTGGDDAWSSVNYLNIWSCNLGGGLLGYAQFPGGTASTDGVVFLYSSIGSMLQPGTASPYNLGRTATHEIGHWLNLRHIWGDANCGNDFVGDTPTQQTSNFSCPSYPHVTCSNGANGDMFMNYMDYTDDGCMNMFTAGQTTRMQAIFASGGQRVGILSSLGCVPPVVVSCGLPVAQATTGITTSAATINWSAVSGATSYNVQYRVNGTSTWTSTTSSANSKALSGLAASTTYEWQVQAVCASGSSAFTGSSTFTTAAIVVTCGVSTANATTGITTSSATINWTAVSGAISYNLQYRVNGSATWTSTTSATNSKSLSGLAASTTYEWQVQTVCSAGTSAFTGSSTFTTSAVATGCSDIYEPNNTSTVSAQIPTNVDINALITPSGEYDWYNFVTTSPNSNIKITLTNLPGDYDIRLYNSNKSQLAISQNGGTTSEQIIRNTTTAGTYYIRVYGYAGANSSTQCYDLKVATGSAAFRTVDENQSITEAVAVSDMVIYPNPATDLVNVAFNGVQDEKVSIRIFDMVGRTIRSETFTTESGLNKFNINLHQVVQGVYFVELTSANTKIVKKLVLDK